MDYYNTTQFSFANTSEDTEHNFQSIEDTLSYKQAIFLITWFFPVIILVGTMGNFLSFVIMLRREMRQTPTFLYLATLAVADTCVLYLSALKTWVRTISGFELLHMSNAGCKIIFFIIHFSINFSAWLIVAVTIERFLAVWYPLKANTLCSLSRARFIVLMIALIFILNSHIFWTAELHHYPVSGHSSCQAYAYENFVCNVFPWIHMVLYSFLPFVILLVFNSLIIVSLVKNKGIFSNMTKDERSSREKHHRLAITLLSISFTWIITTMPRPLHQIATPQPTSMDEAGYRLLGKVICYMLMYTNHSINFFLYCLTGQRFRVVFMKFMCNWKQRTNSQQARLTFK